MLKCHKLENCCKSARYLIEEHCQENTKKLIVCFLEFLKRIWQKKVALDILEKNLEDQFNKHALLNEQINKWSEKHTADLNLPELTSNLSYFTSKNLSQGDSIYRQSTEQKYVKLLSNLQMPNTANYTWNISDCLGSGAQGDVFTGYNINTGEAVAVKVMRNISNIPRDLLSLQERELEVLKKLDHPNIVKLIDVEDKNEQGTTQQKIIIMELCTGGCLNDLLDDPENQLGFDDAEFLNVLKGITAGMEILHSENIVHSIIKPMSIMRHIGEDGRSIYKLIDFGAARELPSNKKFESVCGTEEYLHPRVYRRAFGFETNEEANQLFNSSINHWSIGATLYQVATGSLPFRSYAGRQDRSLMFRIITGKQSGHISGEQKSRDSEIIYDEHLPANCLMSKGLRPAVEGLLARLLESDEDQIVSFEDFLEMANNIIRKKIVAVFDCGTTDVLKVYMDPCCSFKDFQSLLSEQSNVEPDIQLLLHENLDFAEQFGGDEQVLSCREVIESNPVYLFHECSFIDHLTLDDIKYEIHSRNDEIYSNMDKIPSWLGKGKLNIDLMFSRHCCQSLHYIKRNVIKSQLRQGLIDSGAVMLIRFLSRKYDKMEHLIGIVQLLSDKIKTSLQMSKLVEKMDQSKNVSANHGLLVESDMCEMMENTKNLPNSSNKVEEGLQDAVSLWTGEKPSCKEDDCCTSKIEFLAKTVEEIRSELKKNTKLDDTKRRLKCHKLENCCKSAKSLIEDHCQKNAKQLISCFQEFLKRIWQKKIALDILVKNLEEQIIKHALLNEQINKWNELQTVNLNLPELTSNLSSLTSRNLSQGDSIYKQSTEQKDVKQLLSNSTVSNATLAQRALTVAEKNNKSLEELIKRFSRPLTSDVDGKVNETTTYQDKPIVAHEDMTLT